MATADRFEVPILRRRLSLAEIRLLPKTAELNYWEAALYLGMSRRTLYNRCSKTMQTGPRSIEVPGGVVFIKGDLDSYRQTFRKVREAFSR
jgi:hypothetical protein